MTDTDIDELGPIDYLIVEFPADRTPDGSALPYLVDLVDRGIIRVLDLMFIRRELDGSIIGLDIADVDMDGELDVTLFGEAASGLLDEMTSPKPARPSNPGAPPRCWCTRTAGPPRSRWRSAATAPSSWRTAASPSRRLLASLDA